MSSTIHKIQGKTSDRKIIPLLDRPEASTRKKIPSIHVTLSRIKHEDHFRVIANADINNLDF